MGLEEYVVFLGQQTDMEACYSAMDLFILPSVFEGIGIALLEAQANGLYSLASQQVPDEADATGNVKFLPLDSELWGAECLKAGGNSRADPGCRRKCHPELSYPQPLRNSLGGRKAASLL